MKAAIFDFDGTIVDTEFLWVEAYIDIIKEKYNISVPMEIFHACVGTVDDALYDYLRANVDANVSREELSPLAVARVEEIVPTLQPREGILQLLRTIKEQQLRMAIASGSRRESIDTFLKKHDLQHYFEVIFSADDVERLKPFPDLYNMTIAALQLQPDECFAIEDSINGAKAAIDAHLTCYVIPGAATHTANFPKEAIQLHHFSEIPLKK